MDIRPSRTTWLKWLLLFGLLTFSLLYRLDELPPVWWDEGWTLSAARNWVEQGHYGQLRLGQPRPPGLAAGFPVIAPIALSFRLFGVGLWQGRLPGVAFTLIALACLGLLSYRFYGEKNAWDTLLVVLALPAAVQLHPVLNGRQAMAEMPVLAYLLVGYVGLLFGLNGLYTVRVHWKSGQAGVLPALVALGCLSLAIVSWAIAIRAKAQVPPFWYASLLLGLAYALYRRHGLAALAVGVCLAGGYLVARYGIAPLQAALTAGPSLPDDPVQGLYGVTAAIVAPAIRLKSLGVALTLGLPSLLGLLISTVETLASKPGRQADDPAVDVARVALMGLAGAWLGWYIILGMFWDRYLFPAVFLASPFAARAIRRLACEGGFSEALTGLKRGLQSGLTWRQKGPDLGRGLVGLSTRIWVGVMALMTGLAVLGVAITAEAGSAQQVAAWIDQRTPADACIETYESELFFLIHRCYHYPPDQMHVDVIQRAFFDPDLEIDYDPLATDPDYLVVGRYNDEWDLYDQTILLSSFRMIYEKTPYQIYERVR